MNLAIDLGNSSVKMASFKEGKLVGEILKPPFNEVVAIYKKLVPTNTIISSVNQNPDELRSRLGEEVIVLNHNTSLPIKIKYKTPLSLGRDRIAAVVGANIQQPKRNALIIDVGTCVTYDFINEHAEYLGGGISPGIDMKLKAMHTFTASLPLVSSDFNVELVGDSTEKALQSGAIIGTIAEIEEIIRMYNDKFSHLRIIICGGGAEVIGSRLKTKVEIQPELVLSGLNGILEYNV